MVLIKDIDKPKCCSDCRLKDVYWEECNVTHKRIAGWLNNYERTPEWCPLTAIESYGPEGTLYKEK